MNLRLLRFLLNAAGLLIAAICSRSLACGPFFPNQLIANGDSGLLSMPSGDFASEIDKFCRDANLPVAVTDQRQESRPDSPFELSAEVDQSDLQTALVSAAIPKTKAAEIVRQYNLVRDQITAHSEAIADWREKDVPNSALPQLAAVNVPDELPGEFHDYVIGLIAFHRQDISAARKAWTSLLGLPPEQRRFRSTWAAFMLGKSYLSEDPAKAQMWFAKTRALAAQGFVDSLGLAKSSLGWEAKAELSAGHFPRAVSLYLMQYSAGDSTAAVSLRDSAAAAFRAGPKALQDMAQDDVARRVIAAYILSDAGLHQNFSAKEAQMVPLWFDAVNSANINQVTGADRLAWAAYRCGDFKSAAHWVTKAGPHLPVAQWVRAKLLLRDGKLNAACAILAQLVRSFPPDNQWLTEYGVSGDGDADLSIDNSGSATGITPSVVGDLAVLQLSRSQYVDAMDLLLKSDYWMDAAFVAERILTVDELKADVDRHYPESTDAKTSDVDAFSINSRQNQSAEPREIRYLLARRLTRLGRWQDAQPYYPSDLRPLLMEYIGAIRDGHDEQKPNAERAASCMKAARIAHDNGMELLGTELDPDFHCYDGQFGSNPYPLDWSRSSRQRLVGPSPDEIARYSASTPADNHRFHYRYIAADHAWAAAELMPDNSDATASILYEAGCWLKDHDAASADRFYKALVLRCPTTAIGKQAVILHWFPTR